MSTYEFQVNVNSEPYQIRTQNIENRSRHVPSPAPSGTSILAPGPSNIAQPIIIQYDGKYSRQPYGSGETDEGFTLEFTSFREFEAWKQAEEDNNCVDFFKVDSHTSRAVPPRFKEHVKLACSRHTRAGQKKYIRKHPDRPRKMPSKKIDGVGCPATISYKTYVDSDIVRASYFSQHSHEIGPANLPYTRKYRKTVKRRTVVGYYDPNENEEQTETEDHEIASAASDQLHAGHQSRGPSLPPSPPASMEDPLDIQQMDTASYSNIRHFGTLAHSHLPQLPTAERNQALLTPHSQVAPLSRTGTPYNPNITVSNVSTTPLQNQGLPRHRQTSQTSPHEPSTPYKRSRENSAVSMHTHETNISPSHPQYPAFHNQDQHIQLQPQTTPGTAIQSTNLPQRHTPSTSPSLIFPDRRQMMRERWDRIANLFGHVRTQADTFEFSDASVTALEMLLVRLHLESPSNSNGSNNQSTQSHQHQSGHNMLS